VKDKLKNLIIFVFLLLLIHAIIFYPTKASPSSIVALDGTVTGPDGTPVNGRMVLVLSNPGQNTANNTAVAVYPIQYPIVNGVLPPYAQVVPNDAIQPSGTYYVESLYDTAGNLLAQNNYYITSPGPFDIGQAAPTSLTTSNISYQNPAFTNVNNTWSGTQTFNGLAWNSGTAFASNLLNANTAVRNYTFPDASGTVCLTMACNLSNSILTNISLQGTTNIGSSNQTSFNSSGNVTSWNGTPVLGMVSEVVNGSPPAGCTTAAASVIQTAPASAQFYRFVYNMYVTVAGSAGTYSLTIKWTDSSATLQSVTSSNLTLTSVGSLAQGAVYVYPNATQNVTLQFTNTSGTGTPNCAGIWYLEKF
jgi:hypothetical protein